MTNNSEGLSPTLRPQLGVGWNRALPAPFGFDNGIYPDGINDYLSIPRLVGKDTFDLVPFTLEIWGNNPFKNNAAIFYTEFSDGSGIKIAPYNGSNTYIVTPGFSGLNPYVNRTFATPDKWLLQVGADIDGKGYFYYNGLGVVEMGGSTIYTSKQISKFQLLGMAGSYRNGGVGEIRIYHRRFSDDESRLNWNNGIGENPSRTEGLLLWLKFKEFEMLDFSQYLDGSDMRLGIRDFSGNNNHAVPVNMDTNPASPNYVLKPF